MTDSFPVDGNVKLVDGTSIYAFLYLVSFVKCTLSSRLLVIA